MPKPTYNGIPLTSPRRLHHQLVTKVLSADVPVGAQQAWLAVLLLADDHGRLPSARAEGAVEALLAAGLIVADADGPDWFWVHFEPAAKAAP